MQTHDVGRRHRGMVDDEDAAIGKLGDEFDDTGCLLISEVELVFSQPDALGSAEGGSGRDEVATAVFSKTKDYVSEFSRYKDPNTIREIRELLLKHAKLDERPLDHDGNEVSDAEIGLQLSQFEMAQLANLCITEVDEAKALIPTLATRDDALLDSLLQELDNIRRFS